MVLAVFVRDSESVGNCQGTVMLCPRIPNYFSLSHTKPCKCKKYMFDLEVSTNISILIIERC